MEERTKGKVQWFNSSKGYGFLTSLDDTDEDQYFVHYSSINMDGYKELKEGQIVDFKLVLTDKGVQATDVNIVKEESK